MRAALAAIVLLAKLDGNDLQAICDLPRAVAGTSSEHCLACHDGSVGPLARVALPATLDGFPTAGQGEGLHPVGVDYEESSRHHPGTLVPRSALAPELELNDGRVTCLTCHTPASRERFSVSLPLEGSTLCFGCHRL